jgi:hypothetical protein
MWGLGIGGLRGREADEKQEGEEGHHDIRQTGSHDEKYAERALVILM